MPLHPIPTPPFCPALTTAPILPPAYSLRPLLLLLTPSSFFVRPSTQDPTSGPRCTDPDVNFRQTCVPAPKLDSFRTSGDFRTFTSGPRSCASCFVPAPLLLC
ncbi:hypothetical protein CC80DRAFT_497726 [Byssothecium circinans]|uniref:Uncharacterized protein n=1 Tax=Byssothecium circinans TaxID=147558 RepID=A0A6A5TBT2_9PLEO|nr:hypothetical protein CC80DRAFT_497726 [Byssothecium circinans]